MDTNTNNIHTHHPDDSLNDSTNYATYQHTHPLQATPLYANIPQHSKQHQQYQNQQRQQRRQPQQQQLQRLHRHHTNIAPYSHPPSTTNNSPHTSHYYQAARHIHPAEDKPETREHTCRSSPTSCSRHEVDTAIQGKRSSLGLIHWEQPRQA